MRVTATLPRSIARVRAGIEPSDNIRRPSLGFTATAIAKPQPQEQPRKVPLGFVPGATVNQIQIAR